MRPGTVYVQYGLCHSLMLRHILFAFDSFLTFISISKMKTIRASLHVRYKSRRKKRSVVSRSYTSCNKLYLAGWCSFW